MLVVLLCSVLQNGLSFDAIETVPVSAEGIFMEAEEYVAVYEVSRSCSNVVQQYYMTARPTTRIVSAFKRFQTNCRYHQEAVVAILEDLSKVAVFSFIMILFATGKAGLSMPFQCLLCYIQNTDGKKRIA